MEIKYWNLYFHYLQNEFIWNDTRNSNEITVLYLYFNYLAVIKKNINIYNHLKLFLQTINPHFLSKDHDFYDRHMNSYAEKFNSKLDDLVNSFSKEKVLFFGFTMKMDQWLLASIIAEKLKIKYTNIPIVIGGINTKNGAISFLNSFRQFDIAMWGEGELAILELAKVIDKVSTIVQEILTEKRLACAFSENPDTYLQAKEVFYKITLSDKERAILKAFSDEDIIEAVRKNDVGSFLQLAKEKGYIGSIQTSKDDMDRLRNLFKSDKDYNDFTKSLNLASIADGEYEVIETAVFPAVAAVVLAVAAVIYAGAATITVAEVAAAVQAGAVYHVSTYTQTSATGVESTSLRRSSINDKEAVLRIWSDNNGPMAVSDFYSGIIDSQIEYLVTLVKEQFPDVDVITISKILKNNLEGYYGLR